MVHKLSGLLGHCHVFWAVRHKLNGLGCAEEYAHQAWLYGTYSISYFCGYNLAATFLVTKVNLAIVVALGFDPIIADLTLNKVHRIRYCVLDNALNFAA